MSKQQALFHALSASNALLMIFIAVCHEMVGARLFPYGPALFEWLSLMARLLLIKK